MSKPPDQECDSCGQSTSGYSRADLEADGWIWHVVKKPTNIRTAGCVFVCCDACEALYAERRKAKASTV